MMYQDSFHSGAASASSAGSGRVDGVDISRALASLIMVQGHAYQGWVDPIHQGGLGYGFTRVLGSFPLPAFLFLAGSALLLRVASAERRAESVRDLRRSLLRRGLAVIAWGYLLNLGCGILDGARELDTYLRADVLQVIGLSIVTLALLGLPREGPVRSAQFVGRAVLLGVFALLVCPWVSPLGGQVEGPLRYLLAPWLDVPGVTRMPWVPLFVWCGAGVWVARWLFTEAGSGRALFRVRPSGDVTEGVALQPPGFRKLALLATLSLALCLLAGRGTEIWLTFSGAALSRAHPAVWSNAVDHGARAALLLCLGCALAPALGGRLRRASLLVGRSSLVIYVFHLPFCYGTLASPVAGRLDMFDATLLVVALMALSLLAVWMRRGGMPLLRYALLHARQKTAAGASE